MIQAMLQKIRYTEARGFPGDNAHAGQDWLTCSACPGKPRAGFSLDAHHRCPLMAFEERASMSSRVRRKSPASAWAGEKQTRRIPVYGLSSLCWGLVLGGLLVLLCWGLFLRMFLFYR